MGKSCVSRILAKLCGKNHIFSYVGTFISTDFSIREGRRSPGCLHPVLYARSTLKLSNGFLHVIARRLPARAEALQVFSVVLFAVFGWSIRGFLYKIPSFTLYFGLASNLAILCYMLAFALLESALVMGFLLLLSVVLPSQWFKQGFAYKGFVLILVAAVASIVFENWYRVDFFKDIMAGDTSSIPPFVIGVVVTILALSALLWAFRARPWLQKMSRLVMEQLSIFTYIYVPLGVLGLAVVLFRNLA